MFFETFLIFLKKFLRVPCSSGLVCDIVYNDERAIQTHLCFSFFSFLASCGKRRTLSGLSLFAWENAKSNVVWNVMFRGNNRVTLSLQGKNAVNL